MAIQYRIPSTALPLTDLFGVFQPIGDPFFSILPTFEIEGDPKSDLRFADGVLTPFAVRP